MTQHNPAEFGEAFENGAEHIDLDHDKSELYHRITDDDVMREPRILLAAANNLKDAYYYSEKLEAASAFFEIATFTPEQKEQLPISDKEALENAFELYLATARGAQDSRPDQSVRALIFISALRSHKNQLEGMPGGSKSLIDDYLKLNRLVVRTLKGSTPEVKWRNRLVGVAQELAVITLLNLRKYQQSENGQFEPIAWPAFIRHDAIKGDEGGSNLVSPNFDVVLGSYADKKGKLQIKSRAKQYAPDKEDYFSDKISVTELLESTEASRQKAQSMHQPDICVLFAAEDFGNAGLKVNEFFAQWDSTEILPAEIDAITDKLLNRIEAFYTQASY